MQDHLICLADRLYIDDVPSIIMTLPVRVHTRDGEKIQFAYWGNGKINHYYDFTSKLLDNIRPINSEEIFTENDIRASNHYLQWLSPSSRFERISRSYDSSRGY